MSDSEKRSILIIDDDKTGFVIDKIELDEYKQVKSIDLANHSEVVDLFALHQHAR